MISKKYTTSNISQSVAAIDYETIIPLFDGEYISHVATIGSYDPNTRVWSIPVLPKNSSYDLTINYNEIVDSDCPKTTYSCSTQEPPTASPMNIDHSKDVKIKGSIPSDYLCSTGNNDISIGGALNASVEMNTKTGEYCVTPIDISKDWSFQYTVYCIANNCRQGPFGTAIISGCGPCNQVSNLLLTKIASSDRIRLGDQVVFTISVTNQGNLTENLLLIDDLLPLGISYISDTSLGLYDPLTGQLELSSLDVNDSYTFTITAEGVVAGDVVNVVTIESNGNTFTASAAVQVVELDAIDDNVGNVVANKVTTVDTTVNDIINC